MDKVSSIEQIRSIINSVRNLRKGFITNFFLNEHKNKLWIDKESLFQEWVYDTCFIVKKWDGFWAVFYVSSSVEQLNNSLSFFSKKYIDETLIFDIVGRMEQCLPVLNKFEDNGFKEKTSLVRFIRLTEPVDSNLEIESVIRANREQTIEIHDLLHKYMDEQTEQIPYIEELIDWSNEGHILAYIENDQIVGFFDYEKNNSTLCPRHWLVLPEYRGKHIGSILYHRLLWEANDTKRILSWVLRTNKLSILSHHNYGFKEENMFDFIMTNK